MAYVKPAEVADIMVETGAAKAHLSKVQMLIRGVLGGAILAFATTLAFTAVNQTSIGLAGALIFPVGFVIVVLLGLELVTGSFALIPLAVIRRQITFGQMVASFNWAILGHLIGCGLYAILYILSVTSFGHHPDAPLAQTLVALSETKTLGYKALGTDGMLLVIVKAILCNWMVTLGVVMSFTSKSTAGKIIAMWLPILTFFAQGFEHAVVNMFVIPAGMMLGADVTFADWWAWNQLPVLFGNFIGGALFTGIMVYMSHKKLLPARKTASPAIKETAIRAVNGGRGL